MIPLKIPVAQKVDKVKSLSPARNTFLGQSQEIDRMETMNRILSRTDMRNYFVMHAVGQLTKCFIFLDA